MTLPKPGDEFTEAWVKRGEELLSIPEEARTPEQTAELLALNQHALDEQRTPPEKADDPTTLFTDESRRPLLDGTDWNEHNRKMACDEALNFAKMLAARFTVPLAEAALQAGIAALKR